MDEKGNKYLSCMLKEVKSSEDILLFVQLALSLFSLERSNCTALWWMHVFNLPNIYHTAKCCLPRLGNMSTLNDRFVFACCIRILFTFRCKPGFKRIVNAFSLTYQLGTVDLFNEWPNTGCFASMTHLHRHARRCLSYLIYCLIQVWMWLKRKGICFIHDKKNIRLARGNNVLPDSMALWKQENGCFGWTT